MNDNKDVKVKINNKLITYNKALYENLKKAKKVIKSDWDMCFVVDGIERGGKSVLAQQIAGFLDPTLTLDRIAFNPEEFKQAVKNAQKYQAVIYDEAYSGLSSRQAMSIVNKGLISMMAQIGQKNLFVVIVLPNFFELDKYIALHRSRALIHVFVDANWKRGFFRFYNKDRKKPLYMKGKKYYSYCVKQNFHGRFPKPYIVDDSAYREKKAKSLNADISQSTFEVNAKQHRDSLIRFCNEMGWTHEQIMRGLTRYNTLNFDRTSVTRIINSLKKQEKTGEKYIPNEIGVEKNGDF